jgi:hypothetical protein
LNGLIDVQPFVHDIPADGTWIILGTTTTTTTKKIKQKRARFWDPSIKIFCVHTQKTLTIVLPIYATVLVQCRSPLGAKEAPKFTNHVVSKKWQATKHLCIKQSGLCFNSNTSCTECSIGTNVVCCWLHTNKHRVYFCIFYSVHSKTLYY